MVTKKVKRSPGRPSEKQGTDQVQILQLAIQQFAAKGFGGVSINSLAKSVGVADSLFHYHFGSKFELWKSCMNYVGNKISKEFEAVNKLSKGLDITERIKLFNKQLVYISAKYPEFQQIVVQEAFIKSERSDWLISQQLRPIYNIYEDILMQAMDKEVIKRIPQASLSSFILGGITTFFSRSYQMKSLYDVDAFSEDQVEQHAMVMNDIILHGILNN